MAIKRRAIIITIILIAILGFVVYSNSLSGKFIWDDDNLVRYNAYIKNWSNISCVFTKNIAAGAGKRYSLYRPFQMITYMIDYSLWKLDARGYHLTNIFLHVLVGLSIYWLVSILFGDNLLAACTGILFVVHPIHTESVGYISGRSDSLALLFLLLCFIFYIKHLKVNKLSFYILMLLTYIVALFSREISLILPGLLLLYHYAFKKRIQVKGFLSILSVAFFYILLRITVLKDLLAIFPTTFMQRIPGCFIAITNYLRLLFVPADLHMEYGNKLFSFSEPKAIGGILISICLLIYAFTKRRSNTLVFFSIFWFFIALLPVSNLYPLNAYMAEHWLYIPAIGFFLLLAKFVCYIYRERNLRLPAGTFFLLLVCFYSYLTIEQNKIYWQEPIIFYERTLQYSSDSPRMYNNLAVEYSRVGRYEEAIALYKKALAIDSSLANVYNNFAVTYRHIGKFEEVVGLFQKSIELDSTCAKAYNNLAVAYRHLGRHQEAIPLYKKSIELDPASAKTYNNLANTYAYLDKHQETIPLYKKSIELDPASAKTYNNLAVAYRHIGKDAEAISLYKKSIELDPTGTKAYNNLVQSYLHQKQYKLAIEYYDKAKELGLNSPVLAELLAPHRTIP